MRRKEEKAAPLSSPNAAAYKEVPELSVAAISCYCSPEWMAAFARLDLDEVNNDRETGQVPSRRPSAVLQSAPPSLDAQKLMDDGGVR